MTYALLQAPPLSLVPPSFPGLPPLPPPERSTSRADLCSGARLTTEISEHASPRGFARRLRRNVQSRRETRAEAIFGSGGGSVLTVLPDVLGTESRALRCHDHGPGENRRFEHALLQHRCPTDAPGREWLRVTHFSFPSATRSTAAPMRDAFTGKAWPWDALHRLLVEGQVLLPHHTAVLALGRHTLVRLWLGKNYS